MHAQKRHLHHVDCFKISKCGQMGISLGLGQILDLDRSSKHKIILDQISTN